MAITKGEGAIPPDYVSELALTGWDGHTGDERAYCKWQVKYLTERWAAYQPRHSDERARAMRTLAQFQKLHLTAAFNVSMNIIPRGR